MKPTKNRFFQNFSMVVCAFILGVLCTLLIGAATTERKMGLDLEREEQQLIEIFEEALENFQNEVGTEEMTLSKSELWDFAELGFWAGVSSHTVSMGQIIAYYDFQLLDPRERGNSRFAYSDKLVSEQCEWQINRLSIIMRKKFEINTPKFKATFRELQGLLGYRTDMVNANVVCPFEDAGLDLYDGEADDAEDESN